MNKNSLAQAIATVVVWVMGVGAIALAGIFLAPEIGEDVLGAIFMILVAVVVTNGFIWNWGRGEGRSRKGQKMEGYLEDIDFGRLQKRKRDDIGSRLSDLSDDELLDLRGRIQSGDIDEGEIAHLLQQ